MSGPELHLDFETRSTADLRAVGLHVYSRHPDTDVWCACWAIDDGPVQSWEIGQDPPAELLAHVAAGGKVIAHNAGFEWAIWNDVLAARYGWPPLAFEQMDCTAAMAAAMSLPRDLARAAQALGSPEQKDKTARSLMLRMARPRKVADDGTITWWIDRSKLDALVEYCRQDVRTEREIHKKLRPLSEQERRVWLLDHTINLRGVAVDAASVKAAQTIVARSLDALNRELRVVTRNEIATVGQTSVMRWWLGKQGVDTDSLDKAHLADLLACDLPARVRRVLEIRAEAAKSSTAKLEAMLARLNDDGRTRETLMYHGAGTGRWAGRGIQLQNLPRPSLDPEDIALAFDGLATGETLMMELFGKPLTVVSDMLRGMIVAKPGHVLIRGDYSNIEGRVLAWLAGEEWKLQAFRDFDAKTGPDLYLVSAAGIYGVPVESLNKKSPERQIGKVAELACGYQGGVGAFQSMAALYRITVSDEQADEIKTAWRDKHQATVNLWAALEAAAIQAVREPGTQVSEATVGRWDEDPVRVELKVSFKVAGGVLWCKLPSGRLLAYPSPRLQLVETPWGKEKLAVTFMGMNDRNQWVRQKTYGGFWAENVTQAVARDVMAEAMLRIEYEKAWPVVLTVHDEIVSEVPEGSVTLDQYEHAMVQLPVWAGGLPVTSESDVGARYGK